MNSNTPNAKGAEAHAAWRLAQSREQWRQALSGTPSDEPPPSPPHRFGDPDPSVWSQAVAASPALSIVANAAQAWWSQHPLRTSGLVAAEAAEALAKPLAQRHPVTLVAGAFGLGALLMWSRPWSWLIKPAVFASLVPPMASSALTRMPIAPWMTVLKSLIDTDLTRKNP